MIDDDSDSDNTTFLKPAKPIRYDGSVNEEKFYRFSKELREYIEDYKVKPKRVARTASRFLDGRAWRYYVNELADSPGPHTVTDILTGLFNYCFPIDFKLRMHQRVRDLVQGRRSIRDYSHEMKMYLTLAGIDSPQDRVQRLWDGFNDKIVDDLWDHKMSPDLHTWEEI
ncbi:hypothetical protein K474DRAFT_1586701, partial [Panus rudis PR-1116 ss-1]